MHVRGLYVVVIMALASGSVCAQTIERVTVSSEGVEADQDSSLPLFDAVSADGRFVVFTSDATNLVAADGNGTTDVFLRDRLLGTTTRVSEPVGGGDALGESRYPSISEDGRWIAFSSDAANLVADDTNAAQDVFVVDRQNGLISRVSLGWDLSEANGNSITPSISGDGRYVAFSSDATNLVTGPIVWSSALYVRDLDTGINEIVSSSWDGVAEDGGSWYPHISADGRHVAFISNSTNLVADDGNSSNDVFMRDLDLDITTRVSVGSGGIEGNGRSGGFGISADGRFAGIFSAATNLVPGDTNGVQDGFVRDLDLGITERVTVDSSGNQVSGGGGGATLDATGRFAAFHSEATDLVENDLNGVTDIFAHDRNTGVTSLLTISTTGAQSNGNSTFPVVSADGRIVAFNSLSTNFVPDTTPGRQHIYVAVGPAAIGDIVRIIPGAASAQGVNGAYFVTDVRIYNPSTDSSITVFLSVLERDADNSRADEVAVDISPRRGIALNDILTTTFGLTEATGAIRMRSSADFLATSRTYNVGGDMGTFGSFIPALAATDALTHGILLQVANNPADSGFRSNVGFTNPGLAEATIGVKVFNAGTGELIGTRTLALPPRSFTQKNVFQLVGQKDLFVMNGAVEFTADFPVLAYTTVIDNTSNDPTCVLPFADQGTPP
jgi:Tol biopolymer transport system component